MLCWARRTTATVQPKPLRRLNSVAKRPAAKPKPTKYELLHNLLGRFGIDAITSEQFWSQMKVHGFTQGDIDRWLIEYYKTTETDDGDKDSGTARTTTAGHAREAIGERQGQDQGGQQSGKNHEAVGGGRRQSGQGQGGIARQMIVTLTWPEMQLATNVGMLRQLSALQKMRPDRYDKGANGLGPFEKHILGAQSELAVAKLLNVFWSGTIGEIDKPDLIGRDGERLQVRSRSRGDGELILHPADLDTDKFFLVCATGPQTFNVAGWLFAADGKRQEYWRENAPWPAFFIPASLCHPVI